MCKVSVIIPVYNVEQYLPACLDSVLSQTLQEIEVICIDDASPDRCPEILDAYAQKDSRLRVIHLAENHQQGYGRNRGLEQAKGKYVYFLDSDDMITPTAMEELYHLAEKDRLDGIFFDSQVLFESAELERKNAGYAACRQGSYEDRVYGGQELLDTFIAQREWDCYVQREFWRREYLLEKGIRFPEGTEHEDEYFAFASIVQAERMRCIPKQYFIRRYRENSVMTRKAHPKDFHGYFVNYCQMVDLVTSQHIHSSGADSNIAHMYDKMLQFYPLFAEREDPDQWFKTEEERRFFNLFRYARQYDQYCIDRVKTLCDQLPAGSSVWIYGAGVLGRAAYKGLMQAGYVIKGFLVTDMKGNPDVLFGHAVRSIDSVPQEEKDEMVVIAVARGYRNEIISLVEKRGWEYRIYTGGR